MDQKQFNKILKLIQKTFKDASDWNVTENEEVEIFDKNDKKIGTMDLDLLLNFIKKTE